LSLELSRLLPAQDGHEVCRKYKLISDQEAILMAAGAAPAPEKKADTTTEPTHTAKVHVTLKQRIQNLLHDIFKGREDHLGWHQ
jgi:hypothetical protein